MLIGLRIANFQMLQQVELGLGKTTLLALKHPNEISVSGALSPLTVFIGNNGTGKSSVFAALSFLSDALRHQLAYASSLGDRGGYNRLVTRGSDGVMQFALLFEYEPMQTWLSYEVDFDKDEHLRPFVKKEKIERICYMDNKFVAEKLLGLVDGEGEIWSGDNRCETIQMGYSRSLALAAYGLVSTNKELRWLMQRIGRIYRSELNRNTSNFANMPEQGGHKHLNPGCTNIKNVLAYYEKKDPTRYRQMMRRIEAKIPSAKNIDDCSLDSWRNTGNHILFSYLLLFEDQAPREILCLEEPDTQLHPTMLSTLMFEMRDYTMCNSGCQIFLTTHNPGIVELARPQEVWSFFLDKDNPYNPNQVVARCVADDPLVLSFYEEGIGLGAMWYGNHLSFGSDEDN